MNMIRPKKTLTVGAREANQRFSHFLREVMEGGNEVLITHNGRPVARLSPLEKSVDERAKRRALASLMKLLKKGAPLPGGRRFTRDEMHER
jgi:prevent-host-death family protein